MMRNRVTEKKSRNAVSKVLVLNLDPFLIDVNLLVAGLKCQTW